MDNPLLEKNVLFLTMDSCRFDTMVKAQAPTIKSIGPLRMAKTPGTFTIPAHLAFFTGHLPNVFKDPLPYYSQQVKKLWFVRHSPPLFSGINCGIPLFGRTIFDGYAREGFHVLGVGGVSPFHPDGVLRPHFPGEFLYYGLSSHQHPFQSARKSQFALTHVNEIVDHLSPHDKWFLFLNARETHYMYDTGNGIPKKIRDYFPALKTAYNLREHTGMEFPSWLGKRLHRLQIEALETLDARLKTLITHLPGEQDILMVICADHGENLGETYLGKPRFGHEIASPHVINVPLLIGTRNGMRPGGFKHGDWPSTL